MTEKEMLTPNNTLSEKGYSYIRSFVIQGTNQLFPQIKTSYINMWLKKHFKKQSAADILLNNFTKEDVIKWAFWLFVSYLKDDISNRQIDNYSITFNED